MSTLPKLNFQLAFLFAILAFSIPVNGAYFENYNIQVDGATSKVNINADLILEEEVSGLDLSLFADSRNAEVKTVPESNIRRTQDGISIDFLEPTAGQVDIEIAFDSDLIEDASDRKIFSLAFSSPLEIRNFSTTLKLPEGSGAYTQGDKILASPKPEIKSDGSRIIFEWGDQLDPNEEYVILASFTKPPLNLIMWLGIPTVLIILTITGGVVYYFYNKKKTREKIIETLNEDEKLLFGFVLKKDGVRQDELREFTNFSKSKISKVVRNLEKKNIVKKIPYRKTNKLKSKI